MSSFWRNVAGRRPKNTVNRWSTWASVRFRSSDGAARRAPISKYHASTKRKSATSSHMAQNRDPMVRGSVASRATTANS